MLYIAIKGIRRVHFMLYNVVEGIRRVHIVLYNVVEGIKLTLCTVCSNKKIHIDRAE